MGRLTIRRTFVPTVVLKFLVGQVMKLSRGQANPAAVNELFGEKLK